MRASACQAVVFQHDSGGRLAMLEVFCTRRMQVRARRGPRWRTDTGKQHSWPPDKGLLTRRVQYPMGKRDGHALSHKPGCAEEGQPAWCISGTLRGGLGEGHSCWSLCSIGRQQVLRSPRRSIADRRKAELVHEYLVGRLRMIRRGRTMAKWILCWRSGRMTSSYARHDAGYSAMLPTPSTEPAEGSIDAAGK